MVVRFHRLHQGNNFLSCYTTPQTLNMDVVRTRMPEKLLFDKVSEDVQAWQPESDGWQPGKTGDNNRQADHGSRLVTDRISHRFP